MYIRVNPPKGVPFDRRLLKDLEAQFSGRVERGSEDGRGVLSVIFIEADTYIEVMRVLPRDYKATEIPHIPGRASANVRGSGAPLGAWQSDALLERARASADEGLAMTQMRAYQIGRSADEWLRRSKAVPYVLAAVFAGCVVYGGWRLARVAEQTPSRSEMNKAAIKEQLGYDPDGKPGAAVKPEAPAP